MASHRSVPSRCSWCGRFFRPDARVRDKQTTCSRPECRNARKRESQRRWRESNPDYFKGRYENTKQWRKEHPGYQAALRAKKRAEIQDEIPPPRPVRTIRIVVPLEMVKNEIQDQILLQCRCRCGDYVYGPAKRRGEIQNEMEVQAGFG